MQEKEPQSEGSREVAFVESSGEPKMDQSESAREEPADELEIKFRREVLAREELLERLREGETREELEALKKRLSVDMEGLEFSDYEKMCPIIEKIRSRARVLDSEDYDTATLRDRGPATSDPDHLLILINKESIPEEWRDEIIDHEASEMIFRAKMSDQLAERGDLPMAYEGAGNSAHSHAHLYEYKRALEKGEIDAYQEWVVGMIKDEIGRSASDESPDEYSRDDLTQLLRREVASREEMYRKVQEG